MEHTSVLERFLRYVKIDTQSEESDQVPSTGKQWNLARLLAEELNQIGASNVRLDPEHAYVYAEIPASGNLPETKARLEAGAKAPVLGFIAHMDTSNAVSGADVNPVSYTHLLLEQFGKDAPSVGFAIQVDGVMPVSYYTSRCV